MVKILYVDFYINNWGQKRMNGEILSYLSSFAHVDVLSQKNWYKKLPEGVRNVQLPVENYKRGIISSRVNSLRIMRKARQMDREANYDYIFAASYETVAFGLGRWMFKNPERFFIVHNNNLDLINRKIISAIFCSYIHKVNHLVLEQFIGEYLKREYNISEERITWLPHPMNMNQAISENKKYDCVGISNSNEESLISQIIEMEKENAPLKKSGKKVVLRSKRQQFNNGYLKVFHGYLETDEYNAYINGAKAILILFPRTFQNRMSGTVIDALSNQIKVYGTDIPIIRVFSDRYPSLCHSFNSAEELIQIICNCNEEENSEEFIQFKRAHSPETITEILKHTFV